jgi:hypothetical protein
LKEKRKEKKTRRSLNKNDCIELLCLLFISPRPPILSHHIDVAATTHHFLRCGKEKKKGAKT